MAQVSVERLIPAPVEQVWASWDAFGDIAKFNPGLKGSRLLEGSADSGLGARRHCDMKDGKTFVREEITEYLPEKKMVITIIDGNMKLKSAEAIVTLEAHQGNATLLRFDMAFEPKMGVVGQLMVPMMKGMMRKTITKILDGNADYLAAQPIAQAA